MTAWDAAQQVYWDRLAPEYDLIYRKPWYRCEDRETSKILAAIPLPDAPRVLDLACGTGLGAELVKDLWPKALYTGRDLSPKMLDEFKKNWPQEAATLGSTVDLSDFRDGSFDLVISLYTCLSFSERPLVTLQESHRVLAASGSIYISALNRYSLRRLLGFRRGELEVYRTRGGPKGSGSVPAHTLTRIELQSLLAEVGFERVQVWTRDVLSGVLEWPELWRINSTVGRCLASIGHMVEGIARKAY